MTNQVQIGQQVICNGFPGSIKEICSGKLEGMVVVRLARGTVCVGISSLMTNTEILHKLHRINAVMLQIARAEKPTGSWPEWVLEADMQLTEIQKEFRLAARAEMLCQCGSLLSAVTFTCVRGKYCPFLKD